MSSIPELALIGDTVTGSLVRTTRGVLLALGALPAVVPLGAVACGQTTLTIRYAWEYLHQEQAIVPGLVATEYGELFVGREAWDFIEQHSNMHPRADALGLRLDGQRDQVQFKALDFGRDIVVVAYAAPEDTLPIARLSVCWAGPDIAEIPDLLKRYLPRVEQFPDLSPLAAD